MTMTKQEFDKLVTSGAEHHQKLMANQKLMAKKELTAEQFKQLTTDTVRQALEPLKQGLQHLPVKQVEVAKTPNWIADNIDTVVDLTTFDTEEPLLAAWKEAKKSQAAKERGKKVSAAQNILASAFEGRTEPTTWLKLAEAFPKFVEARIEDAVRVQLEEDKAFVRSSLKEKYAPQLQAVEAAIQYFKDSEVSK